MELIYVTSAKIPTWKANGLQIMKSCEAFVKTGMPTRLILPFRFNPIKEEPFFYYRIKAKFPVQRIWSLDLFIFRRFLPDRFIFYVHSLIFSLLATFYLFFLGDRVQKIYYSRNYIPLLFLCFFGFKPIAEIHDYRSQKSNFFIQFVLRKVKKIVVNSEGTLEALKRHYSISEEKILVAYNGVDINFYNIKESKIEARQKLDIPYNKIVISYIGRLETAGVEKGVENLLLAFSLLTKERKDCLLYIVGGPDKMAEAYKNSLYKFGLAKDLVVFTGYLEYKYIPLYLRAVDMVTVPFPPYFVTASPIKIFEFLAAGKIIIASNLPYLRRYLNKNNAVFFESENYHDLAAKFKFVIENLDGVSKLAEQAFVDAKKYSWVSRAKKIINFIST